MKKRVVLFTALSFLGSFAIGGAMVIWPRLQLHYTLLAALCMFTPALASVLTRALTREGFKDMYLRPRFKGNWRYYLMAVFLPGLLTIAGGAFYFLLFPQHFDSSLAQLRSLALGIGLTPLALAALQTAQAFLLAPVLNGIPAMGEELGWRGYLLPRLCALMPTGGAIALGGVVWGLWHAPLIYLGHNYGAGYAGYPWLGFLAMVVFCMALGSFFSYLTLKTASAWPAAVGHAAINGIAALPALFATGEPNLLLGPLPVGVVGGAGLIIAGAVFFVLARRLKPPAQPGAAKAESEM